MFEGLGEAIDRLASVDLSGLTDAELDEAVVEVQRLRTRLEAAHARITDTWADRGSWALSGARSPQAWLARHTHLPYAAFRGLLDRARFAARYEAVGTAWASGRLDGWHVDRLKGVCNDRSAEFFDRDVELLVGFADTLTAWEFTRVLHRWLAMADPDGTDQAGMDRRDRRDAQLNQSMSGMWHGKMTLDPISGAAVSRTWRAIEDELFQVDWAEARAGLGREPSIFELSRTPAQRRADALVEMAARAAAMPPGARRPEPLITVVVDYETFAGRMCELATGNTPVAPAEVLPWLSRAYVERVVFSGPSRVIDVGVRRRLFTGATRRAIEVRDRTCYHPTCDVPAERCEADHIQPWSEGGLTTQDNGRMACGFHNRRRHHHPDPNDPDDESEVEDNHLDDLDIELDGAWDHMGGGGGDPGQRPPP